MARRKDDEGKAVDHEIPVAVRVSRIRRLMISRAWHDKSADWVGLLAEEWKISETTIRAHAAEASRQIELLLDGELALKEVADTLLESRERASAEPDHARSSLALSKNAEMTMKLHGIGMHKRPQAEATEKKPATPGTVELPKQVQEISQSDEALRFWALAGKRPNRAQLEQLKSGVSPEQVAREAGLWPRQAPPGS